MKRKFLITALSLSAIASLIGCSDNDEHSLFNDNMVSRAISYEINIPDTTQEVTESTAIKVARMFMKSESESRSAAKVIESVTPIIDADGVPQMYIVNYMNNQGYVIVSATKDYYPVIAFSDAGHYDLKLGNQLYSNELINSNIPLMADAENFSDEVKQDIINLWMLYSSEKKTISVNSRSYADEYEDYGRPKAYYDSIMKWNSEGCEVYHWEDYIQTAEYNSFTDEEKKQLKARVDEFGNGSYGFGYNSVIVLRRGAVKEEKTQLMSTQWDQGPNFNRYVPTGVPLGCNTIAAGQIMKYYKYPTVFKWDSMDDILSTHESALFLYTLGTRIGIRYENNETGATNAQVKTALEGYGYKVSSVNHNISDVYRQLKSNRPVFMRGSEHPDSVGHAWVCDGYHNFESHMEIQVMTLDYSDVPYSIPNEMYLAWRKELPRYVDPTKYHMNWGWGGYNDGYFLDANLTNGSTSMIYTTSRANLYISK